MLVERIAGVKADVLELVEEEKRVRTRLHNLEGFASAYLDVQRENRRSEAQQYRRLELRLQVLTVAIALVAIAVPILVAIVTGR